MEQAPPRSRWSPAPGWALRIKGRRVFRAPLLSDTWDGDDITFLIFPSSCHPGKQELPLAYWFEIASDLILPFSDFFRWREEGRKGGEISLTGEMARA